MARIRSRPEQVPVSTHEALVGSIAKALRDEAQDDPPVIFEISTGGSDAFEVIVIWDRWSGINPGNRMGMVMEAYRRLATSSLDVLDEDKISTVLPLMVYEAIEMGIVPYEVQHNLQPTDMNYEGVRRLMKESGAIEIARWTGLRLPTLQMAKEAKARLERETQAMTPRVEWRISRDDVRIVD